MIGGQHYIWKVCRGEQNQHAEKAFKKGIELVQSFQRVPKGVIAEAREEEDPAKESHYDCN